MKPSKILVPVDFSPFSDYAADFAIFLAQKYNAQITLFHVVVMYETEVDEEDHLRQLEKLVERKEQSSSENLAKHHQKLKEKHIKIDSFISRGVSAATAILDYQSKNDFDLIVMGTHGRTGIKNWIYGSVAEKVVRLAGIGVITLHDRKTLQLKNILVPVDFSENSKAGINEARKIASEFAAHITYIHVIEQQLQPTFHVVGVESVFTADHNLKGITEDKLKEFCLQRDDNATVKVIEGSSHQVIADYTKETGIDLIVMSTRGYSGLEHLLIGSTTERVVRIARCPVLTVGRSRVKK
jgi:nucleotide-binding universal stress UspA family protein